MKRTIKHNYTNPFTNEQETVVIDVDVTEQVAQAEFLELKKIILKKLNFAFTNELVINDHYLKGKLEYLIVQMYQPKNMETLLAKLNSYQPFLFIVKEFSEVLKTLNEKKDNNEL